MTDNKGHWFLRAEKAISVIGLVGSVLLCIYGWQQGVFTSTAKLQEFVAGFGGWGALVFTAFQAVQVVLPILPGGIGCLGGVLLFGAWRGFLYNYIGICAGSIIAFLIAKHFGKPLLRCMFSETLLQKYSAWSSTKDRFARLFALAIFLPVAPDDFLCYLAGTTEMELPQFTAIILAGKPFAIALYSLGLTTVFPDSFAAAVLARLRGRKVIYYGHSTMEDFRNSFKCSNLLAPLFKRWIKLCYSMGDAVITPTEYSRQILLSYGIRKPIYALSNGVDTDFFCFCPEYRDAFQRSYHLGEREKAVISVGHYIERKGLLDFIALARTMPSVRFFWFGYTDLRLVPDVIRRAIESAPANVTFPGYVGREALREAYPARRYPISHQMRYCGFSR